MFPSAFPIHELAALGAALCWSVTGILAAKPASHLGAIAFSRLRQVSVAALLAIYVFAFGRWHGLSSHDVLLLAASGFIGIFVGDSLLFSALNRLGPRKSGILFALNAPMAAMLGWLVLHETLSFSAVLGILVCVAGVMLAIVFGKRAGSTHHLEQIKGGLALAVACGLGAALGQAVGSIIVRPVMAAGMDPLIASMLRIGVAGVCLTVLLQCPVPSMQQKQPLTRAIAIQTIATGILAMGIGMTLLLFALSGGKTGIISTLSATSPALVLPMLWITTKQRPAAGAWAGAGLVIVGMALLFVGR